jgi:hypothetical protein
MCFLGQTTEGLYTQDPLDGIHPDAINRYYGVTGPRRRRRRHDTGAGHASDEDDSDGDWTDDDSEPDLREQLENQIEEDQAQNIRHEPIKVARHSSPFDSAEDEGAFIDMLHLLISKSVEIR